MYREEKDTAYVMFGTIPWFWQPLGVLKCIPPPDKGNHSSIAYWGEGANTASCNLPPFHHPLHSPLEQKSSFALIYQFNVGHPCLICHGHSGTTSS